MAISKNRLEELIKEGATIWSITNGTLKPIKLDSDYFSLEEKYRKYYFETKEQAEWSLKYHATRTEELDLPMWEEFCEFDKLIPNFRFRFTNKDKENIALFLSESLYGADPKNIVVYNFDGDYGFLFEEPATEENYIKACDLCLKLFKGEE